jgi:hypothetical protein
MKFALITVLSVSLCVEGAARGQGLPAQALDSPFPARATPTFIRGPARFQVLEAALTNDPFESRRALPEFDPESLQGTKLTEGAKFTDQELQTMTNRFRGADLPAWLWSAK